MFDLTISEIARIVDGKIHGSNNHSSQKYSSVVTDSRSHNTNKNSIFIALKGPVYDGHQFILEMIEAGVSAVIVSEDTFISKQAVFILVNDTALALQQLAAFHRQHFNYPVIGITGSNGKTIVKEWLHEILSNEGRIVRSPKSFNSQIGVPLSVLLMDENYDLGIFEAGISQPGEMKNLEKVIQPEIGVLTNIGEAHQEYFESKEHKLEEKLLLFTHCKKLVCRIDNELIKQKVKAFCHKHEIEPVFWSIKNCNANVNFTISKINGLSNIVAKYQQENFEFKIPFTDDSSIENTCHCFAALIALDKNPGSFLTRFSELQAPEMRLEIKKGINQCILINDYYNSDLNSLSIALSVIKQQAENKRQEKVVILSDIQQSGMAQAELYKKVNRLLLDWQIDRLIGIGPEISAMRNCFNIRSDFYSDNLDFERRCQYRSIHNAVVLLKGARKFRFEEISGLLQQKAHQTVLEINQNALVHNLNVFRSLLKRETKIMVMVKAFSYGSGDVEIARLLEHQNVDYLAVAVTDEGVQLRSAGIKLPVIVMNPEKASFRNMIDHRLEPNIYTPEMLQKFIISIVEEGLTEFPIHLKFDTGMNRLGIKTEDELNQCITQIQKSNAVKLQSVFSHLAGSDEAALDEFTSEQFRKFESFCKIITNAFSYKVDRHILNSAGIERFRTKQYEMVRLGIGLYGVSQTGLTLQNIGTLKSTVSQIKTIGQNETVGYSRKGKLAPNSKVAIVPMGYADGLNRKLGNGRGKAFVNGQMATIVGNICMDMIMLDVSNLNVSPGDNVEFFGPHISITELADTLDTIPYEILSGISQRVKRIYLQE